MKSILSIGLLLFFSNISLASPILSPSRTSCGQSLAVNSDNTEYSANEVREAFLEIFKVFRRRMKIAWNNESNGSFVYFSKELDGILHIDTYILFNAIKNSISYSEAKALKEHLEKTLKGRSSEIALRKALNENFTVVFSTPAKETPLFDGVKFLNESVNMPKLEQFYEAFVEHSKTTKKRKKELLWHNLVNLYRYSYGDVTPGRFSVYVPMKVAETIQQIEELGLEIPKKGHLIAGVMRNGGQKVLDLIRHKLTLSETSLAEKNRIKNILSTFVAAGEFLEFPSQSLIVDNESLKEDPTPFELDPKLKRDIEQILLSDLKSSQMLGRKLASALKMQKSKANLYSINLAYLKASD